MNGVHDFGGAQGWGRVQAESGEPPFHAEWEKRALALTLAMGATRQWNLDMSRFARESLPPLQYLSSSYYEIWVAGLERLMLERGLVTSDEIASGHSQRAARLLASKLAASDVATALARGSPVQRDPAAPARFAAGETIRMKNMHPQGHTRLPRYVRGRAGRITEVHGAFVFPDRHALRDANRLEFDESPRWLYTIRFEGRELWGADTDASVEVSVDAWEPYIEEIAK